MLVYRRQLEEVANVIDGEVADSYFSQALSRFVDDASGADIYTFVNALKRSLELEDKKR